MEDEHPSLDEMRRDRAFVNALQFYTESEHQPRGTLEEVVALAKANIDFVTAPTGGTFQ